MGIYFRALGLNAEFEKMDECLEVFSSTNVLQERLLSSWSRVLLVCSALLAVQGRDGRLQ